jgi:Domain of unknown function(DUF2779)
MLSLTKSLFQSSVECSRKLIYKMWLHKQQQLQHQSGGGQPARRHVLREPTPPSTFLQHLAADGYRMNRYVQSLYDPHGNGILIDSKDTEDAVRQTEQLLLRSDTHSDSCNTSPTTIFEGAIRWKNCFIRTDILQITPQTTATGTNEPPSSLLKLVEVKAKSWDSSLYSTTNTTSTTDTVHHPMMNKHGTAIKSDYQTILYDMAYQYYILSQAYPQYSALNNNRIQCSFVLPDKSKVNTTIPGLYNLFGLDEPPQQIVFNSNTEREVLYTEVDVTPIIPFILQQPILYPGCDATHPKTFVDVIHEWNDIMEYFNSIDDENNEPEGTFAARDHNGTIINQFISQIYTGSATSQAPTTIPAAPIGIHCKNCEFRSSSSNQQQTCATTTATTSVTSQTIKSGFEYCWGPILKANSVVKSTSEISNVDTTNDRLEATMKSPPPLVIDLYYGGKVVTDMLEQNKYLLCEITRNDLKLLDTTGTDDTKEVTDIDENDANKKSSKKKKKKKTKTPATVGMSRKDRQWYHVQSSCKDSSNDNVILDKDYLHKVLSEYEYPYHFIDFETIAPVLPFTLNKHPYEPIAFQFSHHILNEDGTTTQHATEFIHTTPGVCPNIHFLNAISDTFQNRCTNGTIFRWGSHENTILRSIYASTIDEIDRPSVQSMERFFGTGFTADDVSYVSDVGIVQDGMVDLMSIILKGYYVNGSNGSASIKSLLLPTLQYSTRLRDLYEAPNYSSTNFDNMQWWVESAPGSGRLIDPYKLLQTANGNDNATDENAPSISSVVAHGGDAIAAYSMLQRNDVEWHVRQQIEKSLLRYCELDTLAMVMIMQALIGHLKYER